MTTRKRIVLALIWALSLIIVGVFAHAQTLQRPLTPTVLSGSDIGVRVQGRAGDQLIGTFVVRINREWVAAEPAGGVKSLTGHTERF
jgi:hypothetical protein